MSAMTVRANGDEVREHQMRRLRSEIRDRSLRGQSHDQIAHWLDAQEGRITESELTLARLLVRHHAARASAGVTLYLDNLGRISG